MPIIQIHLKNPSPLQLYLVRNIKLIQFSFTFPMCFQGRWSLGAESDFRCHCPRAALQLTKCVDCAEDGKGSEGLQAANSESNCHDTKCRVNSSFIVTLGTFVHVSWSSNMAFWYPCIASPQVFGPRFQSHLCVHCFKQKENRHIAMIGLLRAFSVLLVARVFALEGECQNCEVEHEDKVTLLQSKQSTRGQSITVKGPSPSGVTASQNLAPTCAEGFNAAYAKCLGGTNSYLMIMVTNDDDTKAYCAYTGGWAQTTENYPDHDACFVSPGENVALYFDSASQTLVNWNKETVVSAPLKQDYTSLSCSASGEAPCKSTVTSKYARQLTKEPRWKFWTK